MFVFLVQLENLQDAAARLLQLRAGYRIAHGSGRQAPKRGKRFVKTDKERAFALEERGVGHPLMLAEEAVFFENGGMDFVAERLVLLKSGRRIHGVAAVFS